MRFLLSIVTLFICLSFQLIAQENFNREMTIEELHEDYKIFKNTIQKIHPNLYLYNSKSKSDSTLSRIEKSLDRKMSPLEFFRILTPYVHYIRNAHTTIRPPQPYIEYVKSEAKTLPLKLMFSEGRLTVTEKLSSEIKINPGSIITKLNGIPVDSLMGKLSEFTFVDGFNENYSQYLSSLYLNSRYAYAFGLPEKYEIEYLDSEGKLAHEILEPIVWNELSNKELSINREHKYSFKIKENIGYLSIQSFSLKLKPFQKFLKESFAELTDKNIKYLVVDLRDNRGGSQEASNGLLGHFIKETVYPIKEKFAAVGKLPHPEYFKKDKSFKYFHEEKLKKFNGKYIGVSDANIKVRPKKNQFYDNLIFLINENCASTTTSFLGQIKTHRPDALFIGRETLGNPTIVVADYIVSLILPNSNIIVKIPLISSEKNVSFENPQRGVVPDIKVNLSLEEIQLKFDAIMESAKTEINEMKKTGYNKG